MKKDVEEYERTILQKIVLEEQARRKVLEAEILDNKATKLKREH